MKGLGRFLRLVLLIQCVVVFGVGCEIVGSNTHSVIQNAIDELAQQPGRWEAVLTSVLGQVGGETRTTIQSLFNEMNGFSENVGIEGRCSVDFVGQRVRGALEQIRDNNGTAYTLSPWVCHMRPESFTIDQAGHDTDAQPMVTITGFGFTPQNIASVQVSVVNETGQNIVQNLGTSPNFVSAYRMTLNLQDIQFPLQPRNKLRLTWTGDSYYTEAAILVAAVTPVPTPVVSICYNVHLQGSGWLEDEVCDNDIAGTTGQARQIEAIRIRLLNAPPGASICYTPYLQDQGWRLEVCNNSIAGTVGDNRRMEAIRIRLLNVPPTSTGMNMHVCYIAYLQDSGWQQPERCDNQFAGTVTENRRMEAIRVRLVTDN